MGYKKTLRPIIIQEEELISFKASNKDMKFVDIHTHQKTELYEIVNPGKKTPKEINPSIKCEYVFLPWINTLLKTVGSDDLYTLRTNRNRELITESEQQKLAKCTVGVAGMSVGSGIALGLIYSGITREIKIADHDNLDTTNLNRLRGALINVGRPKTHLTAQYIYELDPFTEIHIYDDGVNKDNIDEFFTAPKIDLVVDEIDDFKMKVSLRLHAKKYGIPLIMFTSLGDNVLVDIERFDLDKNIPIFHGILSETSEEILKSPEITPEDIKRYSIELVGQQYIPTRALTSLLEVGHSLVGRPQLYSTIAVDGGLASYVARKILLNNKHLSGRYFVKFSELFDLEDSGLSETDERKEILKKLIG